MRGSRGSPPSGGSPAIRSFDGSRNCGCALVPWNERSSRSHADATSSATTTSALTSPPPEAHPSARGSPSSRRLHLRHTPAREDLLDLRAARDERVIELGRELLVRSEERR